MSVLLRVTMILTFIVSLAAGMSAGKIYAQYGDAPGQPIITPEIARGSFPESEDMLREMAHEMIRTQGLESLQSIEPAAGEKSGTFLTLDTTE